MQCNSVQSIVVQSSENQFSLMQCSAMQSSAVPSNLQSSLRVNCSMLSASGKAWGIILCVWGRLWGRLCVHTVRCTFTTQMLHTLQTTVCGSVMGVRANFCLPLLLPPTKALNEFSVGRSFGFNIGRLILFCYHSDESLYCKYFDSGK